MEHIYTNIDGYFNFNRFYDSIISRLPNGFTFVELGVWKGKSISYFVVESLLNHKKGKIYAVDHWKGSVEHRINGVVHDRLTDTHDGLYLHYLDTTASIRQYITDIRTNSVDASKQFLDNSIDAIFIDASHDHDNVRDDLNAWYPKITKNGIISGHDYYDFPGVKLAVDSFAKIHNFSIFTDINQGIWEFIR